MLDRPVCNTARAMIACVVDPRLVSPNISFAVEDCAAAVENMLLAITALGYATVWLDGALRRDDIASRIGRLLGVPQGKFVRICCPWASPRPRNDKGKNCRSPSGRGSIATGPIRSDPAGRGWPR